MADEKPQQNASEDESKKDTVRINLPAGLAGRPAAAPAPTGPATVKLKPAPPVPAPEEESKKETAVMGKPTTAPKPKSDTSRVQVAGAKPGTPEMPRPTVKLRQPEAPAPSGAPAAAAPVTPVAVPMGVAEPSGAQAGLALGAMVFSIAVAVYLAMLAFN